MHWLDPMPDAPLEDLWHNLFIFFLIFFLSSSCHALENHKRLSKSLKWLAGVKWTGRPHCKALRPSKVGRCKSFPAMKAKEKNYSYHRHSLRKTKSASDIKVPQGLLITVRQRNRWGLVGRGEQWSEVPWPIQTIMILTQSKTVLMDWSKLPQHGHKFINPLSHPVKTGPIHFELRLA